MAKTTQEVVQHMVADMVTDEMLMTPIDELSDSEMAILQAAFRGPHAGKLMERLDELLDKPTEA